MSETMDLLIIELEHDLELYEDEIPHQLYSNCNKLISAYRALDENQNAGTESSDLPDQCSKPDVLWAYKQGAINALDSMYTFNSDLMRDLKFDS